MIFRINESIDEWMNGSIDESEWINKFMNRQMNELGRIS